MGVMIDCHAERPAASMTNAAIEKVAGLPLPSGHQSRYIT
jgi:hypothetical protein